LYRKQNKNQEQKVSLTNPADIQRHGEFQQAVNDLTEKGHMRHYSAHISERTGEDRSNVVKYFKGTKPIGDNFWKKFQKAYGRTLKRARGIETPKREQKLPPSDAAAIGPIVTTPSRRVAEPFPDKKEKKKLIDHEKRIAKLEQQVADLQKLLDEYRKNNSKKE